MKNPINLKIFVLKTQLDESYDYVDSAFEKEIKQKIMNVTSPPLPPSVSTLQQINEQIKCDENATNNTQASSVKEKIILFTKVKRSSFHNKRPQNQFIIDPQANAVISRNPSCNKKSNMSIYKPINQTSYQPTQLILPDLSKPSQEKNIDNRSILKTTKHSLPKSAATDTIEIKEQNFKSVKDRIAYFSSRVTEKGSCDATPSEYSTNLHNLLHQPPSHILSVASTAVSSPRITCNVKSPTNSLIKNIENDYYKHRNENILNSKPFVNQINSNASFKTQTNGLKLTTSNSINSKPHNCNIINSNSNNTKSELKNILYSNLNENKISNLIQRFTNNYS